jgi:hypothetical protein
MSKRIGRGIAVLGVAASLVVLPASAAFAAGSRASCMGHEASSLSPPGSSDESPTGMPGLHAFIVESFPGTPPGAIVSFISHIHAGSHEACDEAIE